METGLHNNGFHKLAAVESGEGKSVKEYKTVSQTIELHASASCDERPTITHGVDECTLLHKAT